LSALSGIISSNENEVRVCASIRSSKDKERLAVRDYLSELCREFGGEFSYRGEYPAWEYRKDSPLRDTMCRVYKEKYNKEPEVIAIHAGLECGIFSNKLPGLDCVSIGPDNFDIHTPMERLSVSSTVRVYDYLLSVLSAL
jgi:dipeptidase D